MALGNELKLKRAWYGPIAYILVAFLASFINLLALLRIEDSVSGALNEDLRGVLAAFTSVSLVGLALQFVFARSIGRGSRGAWNMGFATVAVVALGAATLTSVSIDSSLSFRIGTGLWVGLGTLSALIPSGLLASHLVNEKWRPICIFVLSNSLVRLALWEVPFFTKSLSAILASLTIAHSISYLVLIGLSDIRSEREGKPFKFQFQRVPVGILTGLAALVMLGSVGRRSSLKTEAIEFADISLTGRNLFFVAAIFAYATFPFLTTNQLFSRDLGKRFRQAEAVVVGITVLLAFLIASSRSIAEDIFGLPTDSPQKILILSTISWGLLSISLIPILYYVAHNSRLGLSTIPLAIGMLFAQIVFTTTYSLMLSFFVCTLLLACVALVPAILRNKPIVRAETARSGDDLSFKREPVTIVVPSHNSGTLGRDTVMSIHRNFESHGIEVRVIAVSDGSTDESVKLFDSMSFSWFQHIHLVENQGKGGALKRGFQESTSEITGFIDADGDIPTHLLIPMYAEITHRNADVVFGSKWHPESKLKVTNGRRLLSRLHHQIQKSLFKIDIDDTQVGIKMLKTSSLKDVLPTLRENGFSLDVEIFIALAAYGHDTFIEMPVEIDRKGSSTISIGNVLKSFLDLLRIFWRARVSLEYDGRAYVSKHEHEVGN